MLIKTNELSGAALDWAVAQVEGVTCYTDPNSPQKTQFVDEEDCPFGRYVYSPHQLWDQGGPLLDRFLPDLMTGRNGDLVAYLNNDASSREPLIEGRGATYLTAACRAIVASELGDEVEVPDELLSTP